MSSLRKDLENSMPPQAYKDFLQWVSQAAVNYDFSQGAANTAASPAENQSKLEVAGLAGFAKIIEAALKSALQNRSTAGQNYASFPDTAIKDGMAVIDAMEDAIDNSNDNRKEDKPQMKQRLAKALTMQFNGHKKQEQEQKYTNKPSMPVPSFQAPRPAGF